MKTFAYAITMMLCFALSVTTVLGQADSEKSATTNPYAGKTYIFNQSFSITQSKSNGNDLDTPAKTVTAISGTKCYVINTPTIGGKKYVVIRFYIWGMHISKENETIYAGLLTDPNKRMEYLTTVGKTDTGKKLYPAEKRKSDTVDMLFKRQMFNFFNYSYMAHVPTTINSPDDNKRCFKLLESDFLSCCTEYRKLQNWDINFGVLTTPFKLRFNKFSFSNNLSVGGAVYFQKKLKNDWSIGTVGALSLSSVTLDASSTNIYENGATSLTPLTTSTTRPAFTPSAYFVLGYKNINFIIGGGADYISKSTDKPTPDNPEAGWIYNGKHWLGLGIGFSLFNNNKSTTTTAAPDDSQSSNVK